MQTIKRKRGRPKLQSNQQSIKQLLKAKAQAKPGPKSKTRCVEEFTEQFLEPIPLPYFFSKYVDITKPKHPTPGPVCLDFSCSQTARIYFRENSNLNNVMEEYLKTIVVQDKPLSAYTSALIRIVLTPISRCEYPFDQFLFNSPAHEVVGKTLLMYPNLSNDNINEFHEFQKMFGMKLCSVAMDRDNDVHKDSIDYIRGLQAQKKTNRLVPIVMRCFRHHVERKYYERQDTVKNNFLQDMNVEEMEKITNFQKVVKKLMKECGQQDGDYAKCSKEVLDELKTNPDVNNQLKYKIIVNANWNLITNVMTIEQEDEVAADIVKFQTKTTAQVVYKQVRETMNWPELYEMYKNRNSFDRKLPPFHNLRYLGNIENVAEITPVVLCAPLEFKTTRRFERAVKSPQVVKVFREAPEPPLTVPEPTTIITDVVAKPTELPVSNSLTTSQDSSKQTVITQPTESLDSNEDNELVHFPIPQGLLKEPKPCNEVMQLIMLLARDKKFVAHAKEMLNHSYKANFAETRKQHKNRIFFNFVIDHWCKDSSKLVDLVSHCTPAVIPPALQIIDAQVASQRPARTSFPVFNQAVLRDSEVEVTKKTQKVAVVSPVVKKEPLSESLPYLKSSDCVCLGSMEDEIIISDSDNDTSLIMALQGERENRNPFLQEINEGTQPEDNAAPNTANQHSDETLKRIEMFVPRMTTRKMLRDQEVAKQKLSSKGTINNQQGSSTSPAKGVKRMTTRQMLRDQEVAKQKLSSKGTTNNQHDLA